MTVRGDAVIVRPAAADDAEALAVVHVRTWQAVYRGLIPQDYLDSLDPATRVAGWRRWLVSPDSTTLVLDASGVIGFINVSASRDPDADPARTGEIPAVYLLPGFWGRGHGRLLMRAALDRLTRAGYHDATLWVLATNTRARHFYEAAGWLPDGATRTDDSRGFPLHEVRYRITLRARPPR